MENTFSRRSFLSSLFLGTLCLVGVKKISSSDDSDPGTAYQYIDGTRIIFLPKYPRLHDRYPMKYRNERVIYMSDDVPINGLEIGEGLLCDGVNCGNLIYRGKIEGWSLNFD